jgi:hypothetical protein
MGNRLGSASAVAIMHNDVGIRVPNWLALISIILLMLYQRLIFSLIKNGNRKWIKRALIYKLNPRDGGGFLPTLKKHFSSRPK